MSATPSVPAGSITIETLTGDPLIRVPAGATVAAAAIALAEHGVGAVIVGDDERPAALVSERDVVRVVAAGRDPAAVPAAEVASTHLVWCEAADTVDRAAMLMTDKQIRHLLVERGGALLGIVSARDLLGVYAGDADQA